MAAATQSHLTIGDLAKQLHAPLWLVRRVVDNLGVPIARAGLYRLVPTHLVERIRREVERRQTTGEETKAG